MRGRPRLFYGQTLSFDVVVTLNNRTYNSSLDDRTSPYFRRLEHDFCSLVSYFLLISVLIITMELGSILFLAEHNVAVLATAKPLDTYCRAMLCKRRRAVCVRACVCLSVWHVRTFCQNELTYLRNFFTIG